MKCPHCGLEKENLGLLCPNCGATLTEAPEIVEPKPGKANPKSRLRILILVLVGVALFVAALAGSAYTGLYYGERDRETERVATLEAHYQSGLQSLNAGNYERAIAEFQYVVQLEPEHALAKQGIAEAHARLDVRPTPTMEVVESLTEQLLAQAQAAYDAEDWAVAVNTFTQLRRLDQEYQKEEVEELLFQSLYNAGITFLDADNAELGIFYLDQAIALRPQEVDAETVSRRNMASRYMVAIGYWGVDWELCINEFTALYNTSPYYKDVSQKLYEAYLNYAQVYVDRGEMCPAERIYAETVRMFGTTPALEQKLSETAQICLVATPTPISGTVSITMPVVGQQPIQGFPTGRLAYPVYNSETGLYDLNALYADGRILRVASSADQPQWEQGTGRVIYRNRLSNGLSMVQPEEGLPLSLLTPLGQAWPSLSPDSQRIAYSAPAEDGVWYVYVANTNGSGEPRRLAPGWSPSWGAGGLLAYSGCDAEENCGIFVDNPDDDQPGTRLTGSIDDTAASWAPAGNLLAYMANITGNWDIFLLNTEGGVQQLTFDASSEGLPAWSPDGSRLAFVSNRDGNWAIYIMTLDGQSVNRVVELGPEMPGWDNQRLSWSP